MPSTRLPPRFGKYTLLGHIATGGMAEVYLARAEGLQGFEKIIVIKRIRPELIGDHATTEMFLHEARLAATLEHPNICQVHEIGIVNDSYFFAMEYVHGADLRQLLDASVRKGRALSFADAIEIIVGVCAALHYAHEKRDFDDKPLDIIHRDVSPSNVLISHDGAVKVCDFGIAKANAGRTTETARGVLKGKFSYMSPEQCLHEPLDRRSDVFAIGTLLYEVSTSSRLFDAPSDFELMKKIVEEPVPPPSTIRPGYPSELERIVMKALAKDRDDRYPTAQAMQLDLEAFAREQRLEMSAVNLGRLMGELFKRRTKAWTAARKQGTKLEDHLFAEAQRDSSGLPTVSLDDIYADEDVEMTVDQTPTSAGTSVAKKRPRAERRGWLLACALVTALAGTAVVAAEWMSSRGAGAVSRDALAAEADKLGAAIDAEIRAARLRADGIAATPMLRAAIDTDAATIQDMAKDQALYTPRAGEVFELYQMRDGRSTSVMRIPADAPAVPAVIGTEVRFERHGDVARFVLGAPIARRTEGVGGAVAIAVALDLDAVRTRLGAYTSCAALAGIGDEIRLIGEGSDKTPIAFPISIDAGPSPALVMMAVPNAASVTGSWGTPAAIALAAATLLLLASYGAWKRRGR
jgi:serine/threonine protein kinase